MSHRTIDAVRNSETMGACYTFGMGLTLALRRRHSSQARDVYFRPARLRLAGSSAGAAGGMSRSSLELIHAFYLCSS